MSLEVGNVVEGKVSKIINFGAFIQLPDGKSGLVHISEVAEEYIKDIRTHLHENQTVKAKVISIDTNGKISLSIKQALERKFFKRSTKPPDFDSKNNSNNALPFEDQLAKFLKDSDDKLHTLKKNFDSKRRGGGYKRGS